MSNKKLINLFIILVVASALIVGATQRFDKIVASSITLTGFDGFTINNGDMVVGNGSPDVTLNGEDAYIEGTFEVDGAARFDGAIDANSTLDIAGNLTSATGAVTVADTLNVTGAADFVSTLNADGAVTFNSSLDVDGNLTSGTGGITVADTINVTGAADFDSTLNVDGAVTIPVNTEHIGVMTTISTAITYTAAAGGSGVVATIGDGEMWLVHSVFWETTTDFDCTGDDCTATVGDGNDADGFLVLADANMQAAFTEATGFAAGLYGIENGSAGAYTTDDGGPFIYKPSGAAETIDWVLAAAGDDFAAGEATIYVVYTRLY